MPGGERGRKRNPYAWRRDGWKEEVLVPGGERGKKSKFLCLAERGVGRGSPCA